MNTDKLILRIIKSIPWSCVDGRFGFQVYLCWLNYRRVIICDIFSFNMVILGPSTVLLLQLLF